MSQIGIHCPRGQIKWEECHKCRTNPLHPCHYTPDILVMIERKPTTIPQPQPTSYTPSRMCGCDRQVILLGNGDYYENYSGAWPLVRGTLVHSILEAHGQGVEGYSRCLREIRLSVQLHNGLVPTRIEQDFDARDANWEAGQEPFTGKPDLLLLRELELPAFPGAPAIQRVKIVDYKTTQIDHELIAAKPAHQMQINMYAWLVRHALGEYLGKDIVVVIEEVEIIYLGYNKTRRFTSSGELHDQGKKPRGATEHEELTLAAIKLLPDEVVEAWIRKRVKEKQGASMEHLPEILPEEEMWMCRLCPVRERCFALARKEAAHESTD